MGGRAVSQELVMLGERIRSRRAELGLSQETLAEKAGISANTVSRIEGGQMAMTIGIFIKLAETLDADANGLLGIIPVGEADKKCRDIFYRFSHLKTGEKVIVLQTVDALVEGLKQGRDCS